MMIIALVSENMNGVRFNITLKNRLAIVMYILRTHIENVKIKRYVCSPVTVATHIVNLDAEPEEIMESIDTILKTKNKEIIKYTDFTKHVSLFKYFNGTILRWPPTLVHSVALGIFHRLGVISIKEIHNELNPVNINHSILGQYLKYLFALKVYRIHKNKIMNLIEHEGGDELAYYKSIAKRHKVKYDICTFIENKGTIELLLRIIGAQDEDEYPRNTIIHLSNAMELGKLHKTNSTKCIINFLIQDALEDKFIYSIYKNTFINDDFERETNILVNWISDTSATSKRKANQVKREAKRRYPKYIAHYSPRWLTKK